jgi:hypothetical protein
MGRPCHALATGRQASHAIYRNDRFCSTAANVWRKFQIGTAPPVIARRSRSWTRKQKSEPNCCFKSGRKAKVRYLSMRQGIGLLANSPRSCAPSASLAKKK